MKISNFFKMKNKDLKFKFTENVKVVVTGMGCVTPIGNNKNDTWEGLLNGKNNIRLSNNHTDLPINHKIGSYLNKNDFSKFKTLGTDNLLTQISMSSALEAINDANLLPYFNSDEFNPYRIGIVTGTSSPSINCISDNMHRVEQNNREYKYIERMSMLKILTNLINYNIGKKFSIKGPTSALSMSCASGLNSIGEGMNLIKNNECDIVICGSSEANYGPYLVHSMNKLGTLFKDEKMDELYIKYTKGEISLYKFNENLRLSQKPFDVNRSGIILGEGSGFLILENSEIAKKRNQKVYCEVNSYHTNSDSYHLTKPSNKGEGGFLSMLNCLKKANLDIREIDLISCHATSTDVGDESELNAILALFDKNSLQNSSNSIYSDIIKRYMINKESMDKIVESKANSCDYNSLNKTSLMASKTYLGHLLAASGSVESIIAILCMNNNLVLDNYNTINPINQSINFRFNNGVNTFYQHKTINRIMKNSFAFGGVNSSIIYSKIIES